MERESAFEKYEFAINMSAKIFGALWVPRGEVIAVSLCPYETTDMKIKISNMQFNFTSNYVKGASGKILSCQLPTAFCQRGS